MYVPSNFTGNEQLNRDDCTHTIESGMQVLQLFAGEGFRLCRVATKQLIRHDYSDDGTLRFKLDRHRTDGDHNNRRRTVST